MIDKEVNFQHLAKRALSFNNNMHEQSEGVIMRSSFVPVFLNIIMTGVRK